MQILQSERLRITSKQDRILRFAAVGAFGFVVNTLLLATSSEVLRIHYLLGAILATVGSTSSNFVFTERWVFRDRPPASSLPRRFTIFMALSLVTLIIRGPILVALTEYGGLHYLLSNALSLITLMLLRYRFSGAVIWPEVST